MCLLGFHLRRIENDKPQRLSHWAPNSFFRFGSRECVPTQPQTGNNGISAVYDISKEFIWHLHTQTRMRACNCDCACDCACAFTTTTVNSVRLSAAIGSLASRLVYFPSCSLGQWGIKLPRLAFGRSRSALTDKAMVEAPPLLCLYDFGIRLTYSQEQ